MAQHERAAQQRGLLQLILGDAWDRRIIRKSAGDSRECLLDVQHLLYRQGVGKSRSSCDRGCLGGISTLQILCLLRSIVVSVALPVCVYIYSHRYQFFVLGSRQPCTCPAIMNTRVGERLALHTQAAAMLPAAMV